MIDVASIADSLGVEDISFSSPHNLQVSKAPILDNGLNLIYAPQGYGKSYTAISIAKETGLPTVYFDLESNGSMFVKHCEKNNVSYVYAGDLTDPLKVIKDMVKEIKEKYGKAFIIIDSFSDLFPNDELTMPIASQKELGALNKFFMRAVKMPVLLLDHATEMENSYKIEGNKSGKFKKTLIVLRLDKIGGNLDNGTTVTIERSRDQDALQVNHKQIYPRNSYLKDKLLHLTKEGKLPEEFSAKDLEGCLSGDDRTLWRNMRDEIAVSKKHGTKTLWTLTKESNA